MITPKAHAIMLGFATPELIEGAMTSSWVDLPRTLFDVSYPLDGQTEKLKALCEKHSWRFAACENLGTGENWNYAWRLTGRPDVLVGVEPDERPTDPDWITKAIRVLGADRVIGFVGMGQSHFKNLYDPIIMKNRFVVDGIDLKTYKEAVGWAMGAFSGKFLSKVGVRSDPFYGNLESMTATAMEDNGYTWALFQDINSIHLEGEKSYELWKIESADKKTTLSYAEWLLTHKA